jgi:hypothetical protein
VSCRRASDSCTLAVTRSALQAGGLAAEGGRCRVAEENVSKVVCVCQEYGH